MTSQLPIAGDINRKLQCLILLTVVLLPGLLLAQSFRGSIRGKVVDPSGGLIAGAKVTARNNATGQVRESSTGDDGAYVLAELPAGEYVVMEESSGFISSRLKRSPAVLPAAAPQSLP